MSSSAYKNVVMEILSVCVWIRFIAYYIFCEHEQFFTWILYLLACSSEEAL